MKMDIRGSRASVAPPPTQTPPNSHHHHHHHQIKIQIHPTTTTTSSTGEEEEEEDQEKNINANQSSSSSRQHQQQQQQQQVNNRSTTTSTHHHLPPPSIATIRSNTSRKLSTTIFLLLFYFHLFTTTILIIFLTIRGLVFTPLHHTHTHTHTHIHPIHFYLPLLTSSACSAVIAFLFQAATYLNPPKTLKAALWLSPLLTFGAAILLLVIGTSTSFSVAALALVFALIQSLYACWIVPRLDHTKQILSASLSAPLPGRNKFITMSIITGTTYSCFSISGIGGATSSWTRFDPLFVFLILLSLGWTMHVLKNVLHVAFSRVGYMYFAHEVEVNMDVALKDTLKHCLASVCVGSILVPVLGVVRGLARALNAIGGDTDEFMFSCTSCFAGVAGKLVAYGNRWGFVHVGVYGKGFVNASIDTWEMFKRAGMGLFIDTDLTGSFCFLSGVAGGSLCTLVGGSWALAVDEDKNLATGVSIYAFLIGYFMVRVAMAAPQACVSAYHVAFAENPGSLRFDSTIPNRIKALQRSSEA